MDMSFFKKFGLKGKLILTMTTLFVVSALVLFFISQDAQKRLILEVEDNIDDLTNAIQFSVEKLTSEGKSDPKALRDLILKFKKKGINEISILSESREIIASTNPKKVGALVKPPKESEILIKAELGKKSFEETIKLITVPIIIGDENYGYINIVMHLENLKKIQQRNFYIRLFATLFIFVAGTIIIIFVANKYTQPIQKIVDVTKRISQGDLTPVDIDTSLGPELKDLVFNFNDMINKLRERKILEKKIEEMEHMFQIGQLSSAIAHEIKNPLNFINLAIGQIKDEINQSDSTSLSHLVPLLNSLEEETNRINNLVVNFLEYGRPLKLHMEYLKLKELFDDIHTLIKTNLEDLNIKTKYNLSDNIMLLGDREKLLGCFLNLFLNSIESIKKDGYIEIDVEVEKDKINIHFKDTGGGIPESIADKIFEPYFSSKSTGMGLGLAFTKKILVEHGGNIWLNKSYKDGAEFIISLPFNL